MYIIGGALLIGITLGLLGSGGSILTVPVLVYLLGHEDKAAIAESLAIVGSIALIGVIPYARCRLVDWRSVLFFGLPGMVGTYAGAWLARFIPGPVQLILFALVMLPAAWFMARRPSYSATVSNRKENPSHPLQHDVPWWKVILEGLGVGMVTGLIGVGGGFVIVPALVLLSKLPMRIAVGTSLTVIALNSFSGFIKYQQTLAAMQIGIDWPTIAVFILIGVGGIFAGHLLATRINPHLLRKGFALFLILMSFFILGKEINHLMATPATTQNTSGDWKITEKSLLAMEEYTRLQPQRKNP